MKTTTSHFLSEETIYINEIEDIKKLYNEVIDNISKINRVFGLEDPVEIFTLFTCELCNGYLSHNKQFKYESSDIKNIKTLYGANPITGKSVCRHIAVMLRDVLVKNEIQSNTINVYVKDIERNKSEEQIKTEKKYGNHVITLALNKGKVYLLDSTLKSIYQPLSLKRINPTSFETIYEPLSRKYIVNQNNITSKLCIDSLTFSGTKEELKNQKKYMKLPTPSFEEDIKQVRKVESIFKNNKDIFEILYNSNKEYYKEIAHKILLFKK